MSTSRSFFSIKSLFRHVAPNVAVCDDQKPSLIEAADAEIEKNKLKVRRPVCYDDFRHVVEQSTVNTFDGLRVSGQKQVNLQTAVSHFYWLGSQAIGQPIYQYRISVGDEDKSINVATDADINLEGEAKLQIIENIYGKLNFTLAEQAKVGTTEIHYNGDTWTAHIALGLNPGWVASCSYVQAITPFLTLGGFGKWDIAKDSFSQAFCGSYDNGENVLAAKYDSNLQILYLRRVNPNRVHVSTDLVFAEDLSTTMTLSAEYALKQSKLNFSVDSNLTIKSLLQTTVSPGAALQFSAEIMHLKDQYRFGYGISLGGN